MSALKWLRMNFSHVWQKFGIKMVILQPINIHMCNRIAIERTRIDVFCHCGPCTHAHHRVYILTEFKQCEKENVSCAYNTDKTNSFCDLNSCIPKRAILRNEQLFLNKIHKSFEKDDNLMLILSNDDLKIFILSSKPRCKNTVINYKITIQKWLPQNGYILLLTLSHPYSH